MCTTTEILLQLGISSFIFSFSSYFTRSLGTQGFIMKLSVPFSLLFLQCPGSSSFQAATFAFSVNPKIQYNSFHVLCSGLCCWMAPAAEHLDCNCFPGHLICSELLSSASRVLRAVWVPADGQAGCVKLGQFEPCSPLQCTSTSELGEKLNI